MGICSLWLFFPLLSFSEEASLWSKAGPRQKCRSSGLPSAGRCPVSTVSQHRPQQSVPPVCQPCLAHTGLQALLPGTKASQYRVDRSPWSPYYRAICEGTGWLELGLFHKGPFRATTHLESLQYRQMIMSTFESRTPWLVVLALDRTAMWLGWPGRSSDGADRPESPSQIFHFLAQ